MGEKMKIDDKWITFNDIFNSKKIFIYWVSELGWEIVKMLPLVNRIQNERKVVIATFPSSFNLYRDMNVNLLRNGLDESYRNNKSGLAEFKIPEEYKDHLIINIGRIRGVSPIPKIIREDIKTDRRKNIVVHARYFPLHKTGRNWTSLYNASLSLSFYGYGV